MIERRNYPERAAVLDCIVSKVLGNPAVLVTVEKLQIWCRVPLDAADRILANLEHSGVVRELNPGVFTLRI